MQRDPNLRIHPNAPNTKRIVHNLQYNTFSEHSDDVRIFRIAFIEMIIP